MDGFAGPNLNYVCIVSKMNLLYADFPLIRTIRTVFLVPITVLVSDITGFDCAMMTSPGKLLTTGAVT